MLTQWEQPETSCPCKVFRPGCRGRAGQGANSDRSAEQCTHEEWGGYTRLPKLSGSLEPCAIPEKSGMQSNHGAGRKDAEQTVLRPTISSDNTPEQRGRTCPRNRNANQDTPPCVRIHAVKRAKPLPGHGSLGTRRRAGSRKHQPKFFSAQRGQKSVSQCVFAH